MTNEARAKAVEAADLAFFRAFGLEAGSRSIAGKYAMRVAIDSYLATMAEAGWVMVRDVGEAKDALPRLEDASEWEFGHDVGWNACRAAMLRGKGDE